jgi:hypothetical protein
LETIYEDDPQFQYSNERSCFIDTDPKTGAETKEEKFKAWEDSHPTLKKKFELNIPHNIDYD